MERTDAGVLYDLFAAAEAVTDDDRLGGGFTDGWQKDALCELLRQVELVLFEAEWAGHAATAGVEKFNVRPGGAKESHFVGHAHGRAMMAMAMDDYLGIELWSPIRWSVFYKKFAKKERLSAELESAWIVRQQIGEFIAEDAGAAWFEDDDRGSVLQLRSQYVEDLEEVLLRGVEHAEVVEWTAATEMLLGEMDAETCVGEDLVCGTHGGGMEVVVEGVGPEKDVGGAIRGGYLTLACERFGEGGKGALVMDVKERFDCSTDDWGVVDRVDHAGRDAGEA